jgi:hypothetical protein
MGGVESLVLWLHHSCCPPSLPFKMSPTGQCRPGFNALPCSGANVPRVPAASSSTTCLRRMTRSDAKGTMAATYLAGSG